MGILIALVVTIASSVTMAKKDGVFKEPVKQHKQAVYQYERNSSLSTIEFHEEQLEKIDAYLNESK